MDRQPAAGDWPLETENLYVAAYVMRKKRNMSGNRFQPAADLSPEQKAILMVPREEPLASVANLAGLHELSGMSRASIDHHLQGPFHRDYVDRAQRGWTQKVNRRYHLLSKGNTASMAISGKPTEWAETEPALRRLLCQGQMVEMSYDVAPRFFSTGAVSKAWRRSFPLVRWRWYSRGPVSAVAEYHMGHPGNVLTARLIVPYVWYGLHPKPNPLPKNITQWLSAIMASLDDQTGRQVQFGGVILAADRLAGMRARRDLDPTTPRAIVTTDHPYGGTVIEAMEPMLQTINVEPVDKAPVRLGQPERIKKYLESDPVQARFC